MPRTRIKICGITRPQDAQLAADLGADAFGMNFVGGPRKIGLQTAKQIMESLFHDLDTNKITPVGLTFSVLAAKGDTPSAVSLRRDLGIYTFQLYDDQMVRTYSHPETGLHYWYVAHVSSRDLADLKSLTIKRQLDGSTIDAVVLDTASPTQLGGTGQPFNWHWIAEARAAGELDGLPPIILAGGLNPDNVTDAVRIAQPYAVDVSSGVEVPNHPGIKDPAKLRDFIQAVRSTDSTND
jgi:phosphoribosylanthranilate isomerase